MRNILFFTICFFFYSTTLYSSKIKTKSTVKTGSSVLVKSYAREYSQKLDRDIQKYNNIRKDPQAFINPYPKEDQKEFLNILKYYKIKELPFIKKEKKDYKIEAGKYTLHFNAVSIFNNQVFINNKAYTYSHQGLKTEIENIKNFFQQKFKKTSFLETLFIDQANANNLLFITREAQEAFVATMIMGFISQGVNSKDTLHQQLKNMRQEIKALNQQCQNDLLLVGKPEKAKETLSMLSLFINKEEKLHADELEKHLYKKLAGKNKSYHAVTERDPTNCRQFVHLLKRSTHIHDKKERIEIDVICPIHKNLQDCLTKFYNRYRTHNGERSIKKIIENYTPNNEFLKKSLDK